MKPSMITFPRLTPFFEPEIEYLGNMSFESNVSIPRTPGTPKNNEKSSNGEASEIKSSKVFGPSEGHLNRNKGNEEPTENRTKRVKDIPRREYGKIRDKRLPGYY